MESEEVSKSPKPITEITVIYVDNLQILREYIPALTARAKVMHSKGSDPDALTKAKETALTYAKRGETSTIRIDLYLRQIRAVVASHATFLTQ